MQYVNKLQPKYSSIDLTEVELPETESANILNGVTEREEENVNMLLEVSVIEILWKFSCFFFLENSLISLNKIHLI